MSAVNSLERTKFMSSVQKLESDVNLVRSNMHLRKNNPLKWEDFLLTSKELEKLILSDIPRVVYLALNHPKLTKSMILALDNASLSIGNQQYWLHSSIPVVVESRIWFPQNDELMVFVAMQSSWSELTSEARLGVLEEHQLKNLWAVANETSFRKVKFLGNFFEACLKGDIAPAWMVMEMFLIEDKTIVNFLLSYDSLDKQYFYDCYSDYCKDVLSEEIDLLSLPLDWVKELLFQFPHPKPVVKFRHN